MKLFHPASASVCVGLSVLSMLAMALPSRAKPPNVLFIAVDDLRPELGCYGAKAITPNIDKLAASSLTFDRAYCNQAVCGASRVSLMTGLYPERTNERTFHVSGWRDRHADVVTLNQHFKANGYNTIGLGKIYHGANGPGVDPGNWTRWIRVKGKATYARPGNAAIQASKNNKAKPGQRGGRKKGPSTESADVPDNFYADGARAEVAVEQLARLAKADTPFFLAVGFTKPHLPFIAPKKYWDLYQRDSFALPSNLGVPPGYPDYARNINAGELRSYSDCPNDGTPADFPDAYNKRLLHGYHACVSYLDAQVGKVLQALETSGAADNTIVVFWADHGWKLGDHSSWCKHTNFECDTRVPLIVRAPGQTTANQRTNALVELIDLYPSLCELAGLDQPAHLQGKSFSSILKDPAATHRGSAYSSYPHGAGKGIGKVVGHSIRAGAYRYTEWWKAESDEVIAAVATNMNEDAGETHNLLPGQAELGRTLSRQLTRRVHDARGKQATASSPAPGGSWPVSSLPLSTRSTAPATASEPKHRVTEPPEELELDSFYRKHVNVGGYPVVSSEKVSDHALLEAAYLIETMLAKRPDILKALGETGSRMTVMARTEFTTDVPEHSRLGSEDGGKSSDWWDRRARGLGGSATDPVASCGEENLLCFSGDPYHKENILIHEFAHTIHLRGMNHLDPAFDGRVKAAYDKAMAAGLWKTKYAGTNHHEYFAEGVQSWFNNNREDDHDHNHVNTREELIEYDPGLAEIVEEVFRDTNFEYVRPPERKQQHHLDGYDHSKSPEFRWPDRLKGIDPKS